MKIEINKFLVKINKYLFNLNKNTLTILITFNFY